jgi:hypothetical protein
MPLQPERSFCVHEFCEVAAQFSSQFCMHSSSGGSCGFGTGAGGATSCGALVSGSRTTGGGATLGSGCVSILGFVTASCTTGVQLIRNINRSISNFIL